jgi:hypothetical protein
MATTRNITAHRLAELDRQLEGGMTESLERSTVPVILEKEESGQISTQTLWLHNRLKRTCWYFKALYEYEAFVTTGQDPNSPRVAVDKIAIHISRPIDGANYWHECTKTDYCAKSDEVYHSGGACGKTCSYAVATYLGQSWSTKESCVG